MGVGELNTRDLVKNNEVVVVVDVVTIIVVDVYEKWISVVRFFKWFLLHFCRGGCIGSKKGAKRNVLRRISQIVKLQNPIPRGS